MVPGAMELEEVKGDGVNCRDVGIPICTQTGRHPSNAITSRSGHGRPGLPHENRGGGVRFIYGHHRPH